MTNSTISLNADAFLYTMRGRSFAFVGAAMILRARLALAADNRLPRAFISQLFRARTVRVVALLDEVMDFAFCEDDKGMIYSPAIDRAMNVSDLPVTAGQAM